MYDSEILAIILILMLAFAMVLLLLFKPKEEDPKQEFIFEFDESCVFDKETTIEHCTVQILENTHTGEVSVGWLREGGEDVESKG